MMYQARRHVSDVLQYVKGANCPWVPVFPSVFMSEQVNTCLTQSLLLHYHSHCKNIQVCLYITRSMCRPSYSMSKEPIAHELPSSLLSSCLNTCPAQVFVHCIVWVNIRKDCNCRTFHIILSHHIRFNPSVSGDGMYIPYSSYGVQTQLYIV